MKSNSLLVLACLFSMPVLAQSLPDEINYSPYESRFRVLERETSAAQSELNQSRAGLSEAQSFIRKMTEHIVQLKGTISNSQNEIARLRREIPELERQISQLRSEDSRVVSEIRERQNEESNLVSRHQQAQRDLRPMENVLARKVQHLRDLERDLNQFEREEREAASRLSRAQSEAQRLDREQNEVRGQIGALQQELRQIESRISSTQSQISGEESSLNTLKSSLNSESAKLGALNGRVTEYESELSRLRSSGAPADQIAAAERKLNAVKNTRDNTAREVRSLESQISRQEGQIRALRARIDELRRDQSTLPTRISQRESRLRQLEIERGQRLSEINRYSSEQQTARRNVELRQREVAQQRIDIRSDEQVVLRQRQLIENVGRQIDSVRSQIISLTERSRNLNEEIARASEMARTYQASIPRYEQIIQTAQNDIIEGERDLVQARHDERKFTAQISRDEAKLAEVTQRRENARGEMNQRLNLYRRYLSEAQNLGSSQSSQGTTLGEKEGERLSEILSRQNGVAVGKELGMAEAKYWGSVRGEIHGYDAGYSEGIASTEDINRATADASQKAAEDAELYAQVNFKPDFFEEFVQEEFKKPLGLKKLIPKSFKSMAVNFILEGVRETIPPLSAAELDRSHELQTPLDSGIEQSSKDVKIIEAKAKRLSDPEVAFQNPQEIPFGTANCAAVYKSIQEFKVACEVSYKRSFTSNYQNAARESFASLYHKLFTEAFNDSNLSQREGSYPSDHSEAFKVSHAEGLKVGKVVIYQETFETVYKEMYVVELEKARSKAKSDAANELVSFLKVKPLLTLVQPKLEAENFRGNEEVRILGKVKNVGSALLNGPVMVRLTEIQNAEALVGEVVMNTAAPRALTALPELKVKVHPGAKAGEKIIVKGIIDLPGDLYRPARQETFELVETLSANPAVELSMNYNKKPKIKSIFNRYIHSLKVKISPAVENIEHGYSLTITPVGEAANLMDIRVAAGETGALTKGEIKEVKFSYLFKDKAEDKTLTLEMDVTYKGKVIKKEIITLNPR